jgi:hypothetical protein
MEEVPVISLESVFRLAELLTDRVGFDAPEGLRGKSILDYPGRFRFGPPSGVMPSQVDEFMVADPVYVVWSHDESGGETYTVGYWSQGYGMWVFPRLVAGAPGRVMRHQWALRALLERPLPDEQGRGVVG